MSESPGGASEHSTAGPGGHHQGPAPGRRSDGDEDRADCGWVPDLPGRSRGGQRLCLMARPLRRPDRHAAAPGRPHCRRAGGAPGPRSPPAPRLHPRAARGSPRPPPKSAQPAAGCLPAPHFRSDQGDPRRAPGAAGAWSLSPGGGGCKERSARLEPAAAPLQDSTIHELKHQRGTALGKHHPETSYPPREYVFCPLTSDTQPQTRDSPVPGRSKFILALESYCQQAVTTTCPDLRKQDAALDTAQEVLAAKGALASERVTKLQALPRPATSTIDVGLEIVHCTTTQTDSLREVALQLPGTTRETRQSLVAVAGDWYPLCQQLFWQSPDSGLPGNKTVFMELQQNLVSLVQLATKTGPTDLSKDDPDSTEDPEVLLQMQNLLKEAEIHAKQLMDKALAFDDLHAPKLWDDSFEDRCLLWSVAVQDLLQCLGRLSRRQGLFLLPLRQAIKNQQGMQEGLAQAADVSQRLQEAARLSSLLCGDKQVKGAVSFLCKEVHVLTEALLDVAQILASSPTPSPSLSTRFELLSLELTLRVKALTGYISSINADYAHALQDALRPSLSLCKDAQTGQENSLEKMVSGIQAVQGIVAGGQASGAGQEDILVALESILRLTQEVAQRLPVLQQHPEAWRMHVLQWEWAAKAHYAVAQLQAWNGGHTKAWRHLVQCLKPSDELTAASLVHSHPQAQVQHGAYISGAGGASSAHSWVVTPTGAPGCSVGNYSADPVITKTNAADLDTQQHCVLPSSLGSVAWLHTKLDQPLPEGDSVDGGNRIAQITQEMAKEVLLMAQSLRRRGRILTKDQLIASAKRVATSGQNFSKLICIIAKNCIDQRCSQELLCVVEQIQTMSNQLRIISSVKASLARSKSSEELLVGNAQQLLRAVAKTVRAAEAASLRGLRQPSPDPEELEVAAFCRQWRRNLLRHRLQEISNLDYDELGLRKTSKKEPPTLAALVQEAL
ncbi:PREDICTED: uncharacterized protein LOC105853889 isoform X2 [Condylura cristata]|uniref:uncharacterized protein LOC105853889 isoform X2 n=1 Tax=Condylura cristata TaxID=143302 RepID=UPI000643C944|nr:PREDICTED: uncharacterized protein LOC105853889 isoform X2 [Condylura cristata]